MPALINNHVRDLSKLNFLFSFILLPLFITIITQIIGYSYALALQVVIMLTIGLYVWFVGNFKGIKEGFFIAILLGCLFDSEPFLIGDMKVRLWYFLFLLGFAIYIPSLLRKKVNPLGGLIFLYILGVTLVDVGITDGGLYAIKYFIFYILVVLFISYVIETSTYSIFDFFYAITVICMPFIVFGVIQFLFSLYLGFQNNPLLPPVYNIEPRPVSFFSETTWLSELSLFVLLGIFNIKDKTLKYIGILFTIFIIVITVTRNSYVALSLSLLIFIIFECVRMRINKKIMKKAAIFLFIATSIVVLNNDLFELLVRLVERFTNLETGGGGRIEAFLEAWRMFVSNPGGWVGNGYSWDSSIVAGQGSSLGAKAFNSVIMLNHVFGVVFTIFILLYFLNFFLKSTIIILNKRIIITSRTAAYSLLCYLVSFVSISMFAPIHQYPLGAVLLGITLGGINKISKTKI